MQINEPKNITFLYAKSIADMRNRWVYKQLLNTYLNNQSLGGHSGNERKFDGISLK